MPVNENIKAQRQRLHLSQEYVADQIGVSRQAVSKWETGQSAPTAANLAELAALFNVSISELVEPEAYQAARQEEREKAAAGFRNRKMLRSRFYGYVAMWAGYQGLRYDADSIWLRIWCLAILLVGAAFVMITSADLSRRIRFRAPQILLGLAFFLGGALLPEILPDSHGTGRMISALSCAVCLCGLSLGFWRKAWPYELSEGGRVL